MSSVIPYPAKKIKCFPQRPQLPAMIALLVCALMLLVTPVVKAEDVDHAWLSVSIDTLIHDDLLWQPESVKSLDQFLHQRAVDFGATLADRLTAHRPNLSLRLLPTAPDAEHWRLRDSGEKNSLLISVDITSDYGLVAGGEGSVWLSALSSFWSDPPKLFTFALRSEATLSATFFDQAGQRQPLIEELTIPLEEQINCDYFAAGNSAAEWDRLTDLTDRLLPRLIERLLGELDNLPREFTTRATPSPIAAFPFLTRVTSDLGQGSAFVISRRGFAVTSLHIIKDAQWLTLEWSNGSRLAAFVVERLPRHDLAILSFPHRGEEPAEFGDDTNLSPECTLNVIGYPGTTPTAIDAHYLDRDRHQQAEVLRISAPLEPGYSGGPVLDSNGRVVGMIISRSSDQPDVGYMIPATTLRTAIAPWRDLPRAHWARTQDGKNTSKN